MFSESGWEVLGIRSRPPSLPPLSPKSYEGRALDIAGPFTIEPAWRHVDALVHCAGPEQATVESYRLVYVEGLRNACNAFAPRQVLFTGSTSVYAQTDGSWVDETSDTQPNRETGRILLEAEAIALNAGGLVTRLSGLYGPGRSVLMRKFLAGEAVLEGEGHSLGQSSAPRRCRPSDRPTCRTARETRNLQRDGQHPGHSTRGLFVARRSLPSTATILRTCGPAPKARLDEQACQ